MRGSGQRVRGDGAGAAGVRPGPVGLLGPAPGPPRPPGPHGDRGPAGGPRVLLADGGTRPIADLLVGDAVLGTEPLGAGSSGAGPLGAGGRRYVRTTVRARRSTVQPVVRVRLSDGTVLVAGGEHRFLTERGWRHVTGGWCRTGRRPRLRVGDVLLGPGCAAGEQVPPRTATPGYRRGYLAGVVRGDGSGPGGADRVFPSAHLELEALGRAHHYLSLPAHDRPAPPGPADGRAGRPRGAPGRPPAARVVDGRVPPPWERPAPAPATPPAVPGWPEHPGEDWCAGFLAGVVDARGAVADGVLRVRHTDEEVVGRVAGALHRLGFGFACEAGDRPGERCVRLGGDVGELLGFLRVTAPAVRRGPDGAVVGSAATVRAIEPTGCAQEVHEVTTGTGDVVAEGVVGRHCSARGAHPDPDGGAAATRWPRGR